MVHADCPLPGILRLSAIGSSKCIESMGIAVGVLTVARYTVDVRYWECLLTEVPLYCKSGIFLVNRESRCSVERNFRYRAHCLFEGVANVR